MNRSLLNKAKCTKHLRAAAHVLLVPTVQLNLSLISVLSSVFANWGRPTIPLSSSFLFKIYIMVVQKIENPNLILPSRYARAACSFVPHFHPSRLQAEDSFPSDFGSLSATHFWPSNDLFCKLVDRSYPFFMTIHFSFGDHMKVGTVCTNFETKIN